VSNSPAGAAAAQGEFSEGVGTGVDTYGVRQPLALPPAYALQFSGDGADWMFPLALACGNAFILSHRNATLGFTAAAQLLKPRAAMTVQCRAGRQGRSMLRRRIKSASGMTTA